MRVYLANIFLHCRLRCLEQLKLKHPSFPHCRKYSKALVDRKKKLNVDDKAHGETDGPNRLLDSHSDVLLQRIAMASGTEHQTRILQKWLLKYSNGLKWKWCLERCESFVEATIKPSSPHWLQYPLYKINLLNIPSREKGGTAEEYNGKRMSLLFSRWYVKSCSVKRDFETSREVEDSSFGTIGRSE